MNGGAVRDERSPEKDAMDLRNALHDPLFWAETPPPSFSLEDIWRVGRVECQGIETAVAVYSRICELMFNVFVLRPMGGNDGVDE